MELTQPFQTTMNNQHDANSQFIVVNSDDVQRIETLSAMFPRLASMIKNNRGKNLVLNFRDGEQRSLIVMVVSKARGERPNVQMAS